MQRRQWAYFVLNGLSRFVESLMSGPLKVFGVFEIIPTGFGGTNVASRHGVCGKALRAVAPSREVAAGWLRLA